MKGKPLEIAGMLASLAGWTPAQVQAAFGRSQNTRVDQAHKGAGAHPQGAQTILQSEQKAPQSAATELQGEAKQPISV